MDETKQNSLNTFQEDLSKNSKKTIQLKAFVQNSKYIELIEQPTVCKSFGLPYLANVFRAEYRKRFYRYLHEHTTTVATVSKATKIPHKYLCEVKAFYQKRGLLKVLYVGKCPTTGSPNVQFISTNPKIWENVDVFTSSN